MSPTSLRLASLPLDPELAARLDHRAHAGHLKARAEARRGAERRTLIKRATRPIEIIGRRQVPSQPVIDMSPIDAPEWATPSRWKPTGDGADVGEIPDFLRRAPSAGAAARIEDLECELAAAALRRRRAELRLDSLLPPFCLRAIDPRGGNLAVAALAAVMKSGVTSPVRWRSAPSKSSRPPPPRQPNGGLATPTFMSRRREVPALPAASTRFNGEKGGQRNPVSELCETLV